MPFAFSGDLLSGISAGIASTLSLHPLDLVKVRMQVANSRPDPVFRYKSTLDAMKTIVTSEGVAGLYKGVTPGMLGAGASWGLYFFFYEHAKARHRVWMGLSDEGDEGSTPLVSTQVSAGQLQWYNHVLAAWEGGTLTCLCTNPIWLIKTRMQLQVGSAQAHYTGILQAVRSIVREEGVFGLYRGLVPALLLTSHGMVQFGVYEELKLFCDKLAIEPTSAHFFAMGAFSKVAASTVTYPYQVIKSRLQQRHSPYSGFFQCAKLTWVREGVPGFFRGLLPNLYRVVPSSAITLVVYERVKRLITPSGHSERSNSPAAGS